VGFHAIASAEMGQTLLTNNEMPMKQLSMTAGSIPAPKMAPAETYSEISSSVFTKSSRQSDRSELINSLEPAKALDYTHTKTKGRLASYRKFKEDEVINAKVE
jgi:hypothetical protein